VHIRLPDLWLLITVSFSVTHNLVMELSLSLPSLVKGLGR
jgi:hypothetical protein